MSVKRSDDGGGVIRYEPSTADTADETTVTVNLALPVPVHEAPEDEIAISIDEVAVTPSLLDATSPATRSIRLYSGTALTAAAGPGDEAPVHPALPEADILPVRRRRRRASATPVVAPEAEPKPGKKPRKPAPEGFPQAALYAATLHLINAGDSWRVRERKALEARIGRRLAGGARFVPVLTRKGGVGETTISALLGMALAEVRDDLVIAIDANPDRGTLADRVTRQTRSTVRDAMYRASRVATARDFRTLVSRDPSGLDVLASDADPSVSNVFDAYAYNVVADLAARYYAVVLTDTGAGMVHSATGAALKRADSVVIVSGGSIDEARLASETLSWLESNGHGELVANAIVAINTATQGTNLDKLEDIERHFQSRVRDTVRIPYDPALATGAVIHFADLEPITRDSARELAALVMDGLPEHRTI